MEKKRYTILINGGIGKELCATTMIREIKKREPTAQIITISGYPEMFMHNPDVHRNLHFQTSYIYDDYIEGSDYRVGDPYTLSDYYSEKRHMNVIYPKAYRFDWETDNIHPEIYLDDGEKLEAENFATKYEFPIITLQMTGGNQSQQHPSKDINLLTNRDLRYEQAQIITDILIKNQFTVVQIALPIHFQKLTGLSFLFCSTTNN